MVMVMSSLHVFNALVLFVVLIANLTGGAKISQGRGRDANFYEETGDGGDDYEWDTTSVASRSWPLSGSAEDEDRAHQPDVLSSSQSESDESRRRAELDTLEQPRRPSNRLKCGSSVAAIAKRSTNGQLIYDNKPGSNTTFFMAMVRVPLPEGSIIFCSGALISDHHVLTAAHCVSNCLPGDKHKPIGKKELVTVGLAGKSMRWAGPLPIRVSKIIIHPRFNNCRKDFKHDLAILELEARVNYSPRVNRICLPPFDFQPGNSSVAFYGYGFTNVSKELYVPWRRINTYQASNNSGVAGECDPEMLCTSSPERKSRPCPGDSGGPLVAQRDSGWVLLAINSATNGDYTRHADCDEYDDKIYNRPKFVSVQRWIEWIGNIIENY